MKDDFPSYTDLEAAAWLLKCDVAAIRAVAMVEAGPHGAFLDTDEPVILYEPHLFSRYTGGKWDGKIINGLTEKWAVISYPTWRRGWYGPVGVQHVRLAAAAKLNRTAALRACSWGLFQILGDNHLRCGYPDIQRFVNAMYRSVADHLRAFTMFVRSDKRLVDAIRNRDAATFARWYNGPAYATHGYDRRLREAGL